MCALSIEFNKTLGIRNTLRIYGEDKEVLIDYR